jgi:hypothetical protein
MTILANPPIRADLTELFELAVTAAREEAERDGSINGHKHENLGQGVLYLPNGRKATVVVYSTHKLIVWVCRQGRKLVGTGEAKWTDKDEVKITSAQIEPEYQGFGIYSLIIKMLSQITEAPILSDHQLTSAAERVWRRLHTSVRGRGAVKLYVYDAKAKR